MVHLIIKKSVEKNCNKNSDESDLWNAEDYHRLMSYIVHLSKATKEDILDRWTRSEKKQLEENDLLFRK